MSLYNMLFGQYPAADILLAVLNLDRSKVGRYRDCYPNKDGTKIIVHTRNGGGNRNEYQSVFDELSKHPCYESDNDQDFDCTYADIIFRVPEQHSELVREMVGVVGEVVSPQEKWKILLAALEKKAGDK